MAELHLMLGLSIRRIAQCWKQTIISTASNDNELTGTAHFLVEVYLTLVRGSVVS